MVCNYPDLLRKISELYPYHKRSSQQSYYVSIGMYVNKKETRSDIYQRIIKLNVPKRNSLLQKLFMSHYSILFKKLSSLLVLYQEKLLQFHLVILILPTIYSWLDTLRKYICKDSENFPHIYTSSKEKGYDWRDCNCTYVP